MLTPCVLFVALHRLRQPCVELLVCASLIGRHFGAVVPVLNRNGVVLLVLGCADEFFLHRQAIKATRYNHEFFHAVLLLGDFSARCADGQ